jgi:hypothetical protein
MKIGWDPWDGAVEGFKTSEERDMQNNSATFFANRTG